MSADKLQYAAGNSASTTLSSSINNTDTSIPLTSDTNFAATGGLIIIDEGTATEEYAYYTGKTGASLTLPLVNRGLEGGSAQAHSSGATVKGILSATMWNNLITAMINGFLVTTGVVDITKVVTPTGTQTLTNKTLTAPTVTTGTFASPVLTTPTVTTSILPTTTDAAPLGSTAKQFSDLFLAEGGVINWDNGDATLTQASDVVTLAGAALATSTVGTAANSVATIDGTQTLTNKRITKRVGASASAATHTINSDSYDVFTVTAQAEAVTFGAPSGTPTSGQTLVIRVLDNGTARAITWNAAFRASTDLALPTTTVLSKTLYCGFMWNAAASKWDCLAVLNNF